MNDPIVDTNVLVVASTSAPQARPDLDTHVSAADAEKVHTWLAAFRADSESVLRLDEAWRIWKEYTDNLDEQDFGYLVVRDKLANDLVEFQSINLDGNGDALLPDDLMQIVHDRTDRKFVAVALKCCEPREIVNATDSDWATWKAALHRRKVSVVELLAELG